MTGNDYIPATLQYLEKRKIYATASAFTSPAPAYARRTYRARHRKDAANARA
jgi:hypothetical protein